MGGLPYEYGSYERVLGVGERARPTIRGRHASLNPCISGVDAQAH